MTSAQLQYLTFGHFTFLFVASIWPNPEHGPAGLRMSLTAKQTVYSVGQLNGQIRQILQSAFPSVQVAGEITNLSCPQSGHLYFTLKDVDSAIKAVVWRNVAGRLRFAPKDGMQVLCQAGLDVYSPRGDYQLIVNRMDRQGEGALQVALRKLQQKLQDEGVFDSERKRPLPRFPRRIAVVTSPSGAALRDFLEVVRRRWAAVQVIIVPTRVQGIDVGGEIAKAIQSADRIPAIDAIVVTRGGGSLEDLWGFNDEQVVRAIYAAGVPVISAVGHEIDVTLSDMAADRRALTPTEAGELLVPDMLEVRERLTAAGQQLWSRMRSRVGHCRQRLAGLAESRQFRDPFQMLRERERRLDELQQRAARAMQNEMEHKRSRLASMAGQLESLSPLQVLARGYALAQDTNGTIVRSAGELHRGDEILVRLSQGRVTATVQDVEVDP